MPWTDRIADASASATTGAHVANRRDQRPRARPGYSATRAGRNSASILSLTLLLLAGGRRLGALGGQGRGCGGRGSSGCPGDRSRVHEGHDLLLHLLARRVRAALGFQGPALLNDDLLVAVLLDQRHLARQRHHGEEVQLVDEQHLLVRPLALGFLASHERLEVGALLLGELAELRIG